MVVLEVEDHLGTPAEMLPRRITSDGERTTSLGLPHILLIVVVLRADNDPLGKGDGVEANTELLLLGALLSPQGDGVLLKVFHHYALHPDICGSSWIILGGSSTNHHDKD